MSVIVLEIASATNEHDRYNETPKDKRWEGIASASDKSMMLDNVLEMLNNEDLDVKNSWLRLVYYTADGKTIEKVEVF